PDPVRRRPWPVEAAGDEAVLDGVAMEGGQTPGLTDGRLAGGAMLRSGRQRAIADDVGREDERDTADAERNRAGDLDLARAQGGLDELHLASRPRHARRHDER